MSKLFPLPKLPFLSITAATALSAVAAFSFVRADDPIKPDVGPQRGKDVLVIQESRDAQNFDAENQDVTVQGNNNRVTIKGTCHALTVSGSNNQVSVAAVTSIALSGGENQVSWSKANGGEKPQVTDLGKGNKVSHTAPKE